MEYIRLNNKWIISKIVANELISYPSRPVSRYGINSGGNPDFVPAEAENNNSKNGFPIKNLGNNGSEIYRL